MVCVVPNLDGGKAMKSQRVTRKQGHPATCGIPGYRNDIRRAVGKSFGLVLKPLIVAVSLLAVASAASAQGYPERPVKLIVPYAAGGATDAFARLIGEHLGKALGKPFVIENKPGGSA